MATPSLHHLRLRAPSLLTTHTPILRAHHRFLTSTPSTNATPLPLTATGPPPKPPHPSPSESASRLTSMRKKTAAIARATELRTIERGGKSSPLRKRFWTHVRVVDSSPAHNGYEIHLDTRPVRTPTKKVLVVPRTKPQLAHAVALEWELLSSAQQALKGHNIPMTGIVCRALELGDGDAEKARGEVLRMLMRYFDTDTLLCWAPEGAEVADKYNMDGKRREGGARRGGGSSGGSGGKVRSLRSIQRETAEQIIGFLKTTVWPGVEIVPVLEDGGIMPASQSEVTRSVISGWISGLPAFELAALERAVLASKSLLVGTRLLVEWSEEFRHLQRSGQEKRFGIEEAALASTIEVRWQTGVWGEVEDTHDVEHEDVRRQLGSAVLLVAGAR